MHFHLFKILAIVVDVDIQWLNERNCNYKYLKTLQLMRKKNVSQDRPGIK
jgi:hypothetical protein